MKIQKIKKDVYLIWKKLGETPLQSLERLRKALKIGGYVPMTYAGRLDPLAEGELLVLIGEECKNKEKYLTLDKEYEVEILLGAQTDTGDVMGKIVDSAKSLVGSFGNDSDNILRSVLQEFVGTVRWEYPAFSSKTVQGKPLFLWALEGRINEIDIPTRESEIYELGFIKNKLGGLTTRLSMSELRDLVHMKINSIKPVKEYIKNGKDTKKLGADFRRKEVLQSWVDFFNECAESPLLDEFQVLKIKCACSSGTYMRTLAKKLGDKLGMPASALSIVRTKVLI